MPSIGLGALAGALVWALRRRRPRPLAESGPGPRIAASGPTVWALGLAVLVALAPTGAWLFSEYTESVWRNVHGIFVPVVMLLLARHALRRDDRSDPEASAWGFAFLLPALGLLVIDSAVRSYQLSAIGLVLALPGLSLLLLGARRTRMLALPLAIGAFLVPVPSNFEAPLGLPAATAIAMEPVVKALGVPAVREGASFELSNGWIGISRNCSGLATLYAAVALGVLLACTSRPGLRRFLPLLIALPLTLLLNAARGVVLVVLYDGVGSEILETPLHGLSGIAVCWTVFATLWWVGDRRGLREALS